MSSASFRGPRRLRRQGREISKLRRASVGGMPERGHLEAELVSLDIAWETLREVDPAFRARAPIAEIPAKIDGPKLADPEPSREALDVVLKSAWSNAQLPRPRTDAASGAPAVRHRY